MLRLDAPFRLIQALAAANFVVLLRIPPRELGFTRPANPRWLWGAPAALVAARLLFAAFVVASIYYAGQTPKLALEPVPRLPALEWLEVLLLAPVLEEIYYRGVMHQLTRDWPAWLAVGFIAALFATSHFLGFFATAGYARAHGLSAIGGSWGLLAPFLAVPVHLSMSVVYSLVYLRSGSLYPAIALHAAFNALQLLAAVDYGVPLLPPFRP